jgi:hypothetical protein
MEEFMGKLVLGVAVLSAGAASAQVLYPGYGYAPYGYGYAAMAPLYDYAAPGYGYTGYGYATPAVAPAQAGTTIVIVTPAPAYTAPVSRPLYSYAPGYWGGYGWGDMVGADTGVPGIGGAENTQVRFAGTAERGHDRTRTATTAVAFASQTLAGSPPTYYRHGNQLRG